MWHCTRPMSYPNDPTVSPGLEDNLLKRIKISRFKSIVDQSIEFGKVNLFVGGNGSGKSNLLEAVGVISSALYRGVSDADLFTKGVRLSTPAFFKSAFKNRRLPSTLRIEVDFDNNCSYNFELMASDFDIQLRFNTESAEYNGLRVFGRSGNGATALGKSLTRRPNEYRGMFDQLRSLQEFPEPLIEQFDKIARFAIYAPQTEFLRGTQIGSVQTPPIGLHGEGLPQATASLISRWRHADEKLKSKIDDAFELAWATGWANLFRVGVINPILFSSQIKTGDQTLYFQDKYLNRKRNTVTAYDSSEGILFLLFLIIILTHEESPKIFALDNVDNALNPRMTKFAVSKIINMTTHRSFKKVGLGPDQVFMTSHNPTAMDAFDIFDDRFRIFVVVRDNNGYTKVNRLKVPDKLSREEWVSLHAGRSLSELWISGEIPGALGAKI